VVRAAEVTESIMQETRTVMKRLEARMPSNHP